jgi:uncharacterized membrane protein
MNTDQIGEKEKTQILLNEYNSLRNEINARISNAFQVAAIATGAVALCFQSQWQGQVRDLALLIIVLGTIILLWIIFHNFFNAGLRVQELESDINRRVKEKLLIWENERGGLAIRDWQLNLLLTLLKLRRPKDKSA